MSENSKNWRLIILYVKDQNQGKLSEKPTLNKVRENED